MYCCMLLQDEDRSAYVVYSSNGNKDLHIGRLSRDYTDVIGAYKKAVVGDSREAPALFRHGKRYYMVTSGCTGWDPNKALVHSARYECMLDTELHLRLLASLGITWHHQRETAGRCLALSRHGERHYTVTSGCTGWGPNKALVHSAGYNSGSTLKFTCSC